MKKYKITLLFIILSFIGVSQNTFILDDNNKIFELNADYSLTQIASLNVPDGNLFDIAISPDGTFYGIKYPEGIIEIDLQNNSYSILTALPFFGNSLVCNNNNELFTVNAETTELVKYSIQSNTLETVTQLFFAIPGDLTFYEGNLIFKDLQSNRVIAYNLDNDSCVCIFCLPDMQFGFLGLTNVFDSCQSNTVIADIEDEIYKIDIVNDMVINLNCNITTYGMASTTEHLASNCNFSFNNIDCLTSVSNVEFSKEDINLYPNPIKGILHLNTKLKIHVIEIYDIKGCIIKSFIAPENTIDLNGLDKGFYILKLQIESDFIIKKIVLE